MAWVCAVSCSPECFQVDWQTLQMLVLPAAYIADGLEAWKIMGLRGTGTYYLDIMFLVPREELTDPIKEFPLRNVGDTRAVCIYFLTWSALLNHGGSASSINLPLCFGQSSCMHGQSRIANSM